jgi:hypothetical protein
VPAVTAHQSCLGPSDTRFASTTVQAIDGIVLTVGALVDGLGWVGHDREALVWVGQVIDCHLVNGLIPVDE